MNVRQCIFLVGGRGTRLGAHTADMPKPLLDVAGRPFLDHLIANAGRFGLDRFILLGGYQGAKLHDHYRSAGVEIIVEPEAAGTAGALHFAADRLDPVFFLCNGDSFFDFNMLDLATPPFPEPWLARIALRGVEDGSRYGSVECDGERIIGFGEKGRSGPAMINAGIYLLRREILSHIATKPCSIEQEIFPALVQAGLLFGRPYQGNFIDIGIPDSLSEARDHFDRFLRRPAVFLPSNWVLTSSGGTVGLRPEAARCVKLCNDRNYFAFVIQDDAAREGMLDKADLAGLINERLHPVGAHIDAVLGSPSDGACPWPYLPEKSLFVVQGDGCPVPQFGTAVPLDTGSIVEVLEKILSTDVA